MNIVIPEKVQGGHLFFQGQYLFPTSTGVNGSKKGNIDNFKKVLL